VQPATSSENSVEEHGKAGEGEGESGGDTAGDREEEAFLELVEYLKRVRLDAYALRLRKEFGVCGVPGLSLSLSLSLFLSLFLSLSLALSLYRLSLSLSLSRVSLSLERERTV
jgi:hypothetical protein